MSDAQDQQSKQQQFAALLLRIERAAVLAAINSYLMQIAALQRQARALLLTRAAEDAARAIARDLESVAPHMIDERALLAAADTYAAQAVDLGIRWAGGTTPLEPDPLAQRAMQAAVASAEDRVRVAVKLLAQADSPVKVQSALKVASNASRNLATGAEYAVNFSSNSAIRRTAALAGAHLLWVAERDACVVCLALSGHTVDPSTGEAFDETATFDPTHHAPEVWPPGMPLIQPPRHPHCRCILQVWYGSAVTGVPDLPDVLQREALRSVARGWSLPSESNAARSRAAEHILRTGLADRLPKSVRAEAERGAAGRFSSRTHPPHRTRVR